MLGVDLNLRFPTGPATPVVSNLRIADFSAKSAGHGSYGKTEESQPVLIFPAMELRLYG
ncbi:hypothetical protein [Neglectibacter timonensis]|jgi:hypothetical protein|uniref:hypothetical protein n=1 Tax=Neglectibacter timonensis TaxID=1776382 RepID=UPI0012B61D4A|nr:hypothetical protein [Neglectibacter timonensis]MCQ4844494.1 hypothetical protein [Neglectibacter timonensis]MEE0730718.1 hypothetical protein [Oscillospiraceae bacterium]